MSEPSAVVCMLSLLVFFYCSLYMLRDKRRRRRRGKNVSLDFYEYLLSRNVFDKDRRGREGSSSRDEFFSPKFLLSGKNAYLKGGLNEVKSLK